MSRRFVSGIGRQRKRLAASALVAAIPITLLLAACGGGDETEEPTAGTAGAAGTTAPKDEEAPGETAEQDPSPEAEETPELPEVPEGAQVFEISATEYAFSDPELSVEAGQLAAVILTNSGNVRHNWTIHDASGEEIAIAQAKPGEAAVALFTVDAGTYEVWCTVVGHKSVGMVGSVTAA